MGEPSRAESLPEEATSQAFWEGLGLPPREGRLGPARGPLVHQLLAIPVGPEPDAQRWTRLVVADAEARFLALRQQASRAEPCVSEGAGSLVPEEGARARAIWVRTSPESSVSVAELSARVTGMVERLAASQLVVLRDAPMRLCPRCREPRAPAEVLYNAEKGPSYLVRFPLRDSSPPTSLLVWTDALWKLLGATAILVNPDLRYAVVRYQRRDINDRIVVAENALPRLSEWLPGATLEVLETKAGEEVADSTYDHPFGGQSPELAALPGPAGSVLPSAEVGDSGTGIVALVPAHGASDAIVARSLRVPGFSVLDVATTRLVGGPPKYTGLPVGIAESMLLHDLTESGHLFAELRVRRGVPHCCVCGSEILWAPGRTWCLEPGRMNDATSALFARLLPGEPLPRSAEAVPWPVAELGPTNAEAAPQFWECPVCERLGLPEEAAVCTCGQTRQRTRRDLLPGFRRPLEAWARITPLADGDSVRLYLSERRKHPTLMHHLVAIEAARVEPKSIRAVSLSTLPHSPEIPPLGPLEAADAFRASLIRASRGDRTAWAFSQLRTQEARRLAGFLRTIHALATELHAGRAAGDAGTIVAHVDELLEEDRAFLSAFERMRLETLGLYDASLMGRGYEHLVAFFEHDFREAYLHLVRRRREEPNSSPEKRSYLLTVAHVLDRWLELAAPVIPFTAEALARQVSQRPSSVFERPVLPVVESLLDSTLDRRYRQWQSIGTAVDRLQARLGPEGVAQAQRLVVLADSDEAAKDLDESVATLSRLTGASQVDVASPQRPWSGRQMSARPIPEEIRRVYPGRERRILKIVEQLPAARVRAALDSDSLSIVVDGHSLPLRPSMFEFGETIPTDSHPAPWRHGEVLLTGLPASTGAAELPLLPFDAEQLVERVRRDVSRQRRRAETVVGVSVWSDGELKEQLLKNAAPIARYLELEQFEVVPDSRGFVAAERRDGRTPGGRRWSYWVRGSRLSRRPSKRRTRQRSAVRWAPMGEVALFSDPQADYASESSRARDAEVETMVEAMDGALGAPWMGPAKALSAWEAGYHDADHLLAAPYERLVQLPGFGPWLAAEVVRLRGEEVPRKPILSPPEAVENEDAGVGGIEGAAEPSAASSFSGDSTAVVPVPTAPDPEMPLPLAETAPVAGTAGSRPRPARGSIAGSGRGGRGAPTPARGPDVPVSPSADDPHEVAPVVAVVAAAAVVQARPRPAVAPAVLTGAAEVVPPISEPAQPVSGVELVVDRSSEWAWQRFLDATSAGHRGLCVSRETPARVRTFVGPRDVDIAWISNLGRSDALAPSNVDGLRSLFRQAIEDRGVTAVFVESFEYLVTVQSVDRAIAWLNELDELAKSRSARVWIPLNPGLVERPAYDQLVAAFPQSDD